MFHDVRFWRRTCHVTSRFHGRFPFHGLEALHGFVPWHWFYLVSFLISKRKRHVDPNHPSVGTGVIPPEHFPVAGLNGEASVKIQPNGPAQREGFLGVRAGDSIRGGLAVVGVEPVDRQSEHATQVLGDVIFHLENGILLPSACAERIAVVGEKAPGWQQLESGECRVQE